MTSTDIERMAARPAVATPGFVGQGTAIEQSRAVAEVQAAIFVAQQMPRDEDRAIAEMERTCRRRPLAEAAFYSYPKGGQNVSGPSIHLARELARIWGNIQHGVTELRRDDAGQFSEMQAMAWDLQSNTRSSQIFVVPHRRDTRSGPKPLVDLREVYESNSNNGARRLRAAIFSVLPRWFTDRAIEVCQETLRAGDGTQLSERIAKMLEAFAGKSVDQARIEARLGRPTDEWTADDVANLGNVYRSIQRGELSTDEAFPAANAGTGAADEIAAQTRGQRTRASDPEAAAAEADMDQFGGRA